MRDQSGPPSLPPEKIVTFSPAYDKRPKYGIHGVELRMVLRYIDGAVQFVLYTSWQLPHITKETDAQTLSAPLDQTQLDCFYHPRPIDLGYHSFAPRYEGQTNMGPCEYLNGHDCYYDGSSLNADRIFNVLLAEGSDGVWRELEKYYQAVFHGTS